MSLLCQAGREQALLSRPPGKDHMAKNDDDAARAMFEWANSVPPAELAAEFMAAFRPHGYSGGNDLDVSILPQFTLAKRLFREYPNTSSTRSYANKSQALVREALQLLEHAELVVSGGSSIVDGDPRWSATRLGLSALASGKAVVRQRIKDRTGL